MKGPAAIQTLLDRLAAPPVTPEHLRAEGIGAPFMDYLPTWRGFMAETVDTGA